MSAENCHRRRMGKGVAEMGTAGEGEERRNELIFLCPFVSFGSSHDCLPMLRVVIPYSAY